MEQGVRDTEKPGLRQRAAMHLVGCEFNLTPDHLVIKLKHKSIEQAIVLGFKKSIEKRVLKEVHEGIMVKNGATKEDYEVRVK